MNFAAQIELITVPQEFTRLCNAVLSAVHGDDFLPIDDDRADRGNDGYLKTEKRMFAVHCFKRIQKQGLDQEVRAKMIGDLGKASALKSEGIWEIDRWTFLSNYPISEGVAAEILELGRRHGIDVSWRGPDFFASELQSHPEIRNQFPSLQVNEVTERLDELQKAVSEDTSDEAQPKPFTDIPHTLEEQAGLFLAKPDGWEYILFAGALAQRQDRLEGKWRDHELRLPGSDRVRLDDEAEALSFIRTANASIQITISVINRLFDPTVLERAFGVPGEPGDAAQIEHIASRVMSMYEEMMDWAASIRGCIVPEKYERLYELTPQMIDASVTAVRKFVSDAVDAATRIQEIFAGPKPDEPVKIEIELVLSVDEGISEAVTAELDRIRRT
jgi:hypothetical protein